MKKVICKDGTLLITAEAGSEIHEKVAIIFERITQDSD